LGEIEAGFDDIKTVELDEGVVYKPSLFSFGGYMKLLTIYNFADYEPDSGETDWQGLNRLRAELKLDLTFDFPGSWKLFVSGKGNYDFAFIINGREEYTSEVLDRYENEAEFDETYLFGRLFNQIDIKVGRQIMGWGKADMLRVTDVLNPIDRRDFGLVDIDDLKLPVTMTRFDTRLGQWGLSASAIHEIRFNKSWVYGSEFYPGKTPPPDEDVPSSTIDNTEFALALNRNFKGWDIAFFFADIYDDTPHYERVISYPSGPPLVKLRHSRLHMFGAAMAMVNDNWLWKAEGAYFDGIEFFNVAGQTFSRADFLLGFEYTGFRETTISVEAAHRHLLDFDSRLEASPDNAREDLLDLAMKITRSFRHQTLRVNLTTNVYSDYARRASAFQHFFVEYDVSDSIEVAAGIVFYQSGEQEKYRNIGNNDRVHFDIKYSF